MSAILGLMAILGLAAGDSINKNIQAQKSYVKLESTGAFLPSSEQRRSFILQDIWEDWFGERKMFPEAYQGYLEQNKAALDRYVLGLLSQIEIAEGYRPSFCVGTYDKNSYVPFSSFYNLYGEKIKLFNTTGKYYS